MKYSFNFTMESGTLQATETSETLLNELSSLNENIENVIRDELEKLRLEELKLKKLILTKAKQDLFDLLKNDPSIKKGDDDGAVEISVLSGTDKMTEEFANNTSESTHVVQAQQNSASNKTLGKTRNLRESIDDELVNTLKNNLPKNALAKTVVIKI